MKRFICLFLALIMAFSLAACSGNDDPVTTNGTTDATDGTGVFMAGYCKTDITPTEVGLPLMGYSNDASRLSTGMYTYLYANTLVVQDAEGNKAMIISVDSTAVGSAVCDPVREAISKKTGIPVDSIMITSIHQHSTPAFSSSKFSSSGKYAKHFQNRIIESAEKAMNDMAPATISIANVETEGLSFVRQYLMNDGTYCGANYGDPSSGYKAHESEADNELQLVKFDREGQTTVGGKKAKNILLSNFQGHPHTGTSSEDTNVSADVPGIYREEVENATDYHVMYVSGAQGNLNMSSRITEENHYSTFQERGKALAQYAINAINENAFIPVNTGKVQGVVQIIEGQADHSMDHLLAEASLIDAEWTRSYDQQAAMALGTSGQIHSVYHASAIIQKSREEATKLMPVIAISFGDIAICGGQYEMFDTNGMEIKEGSPFAMTFIANMANGTQGYVPSALGYKNGCYSADITRYAPGTGEELRDAFLQMLKVQREAQ